MNEFVVAVLFDATVFKHQWKILIITTFSSFMHYYMDFSFA